MQPVYCAKTPHEKAMQRALLQFRNPDNYDLVHEALIKAGRADLIGYSGKCLIIPEKRDAKANIGGSKGVRSNGVKTNGRAAKGSRADNRTGRKAVNKAEKAGGANTKSLIKRNNTGKVKKR